jgi:cell division protein FtsI/penicillin-binding protein 2
MQTLAFYNAVANNGVMVKPQFVSEIKEWNKTIVKMEGSYQSEDMFYRDTFKVESSFKM